MTVTISTAFEWQKACQTVDKLIVGDNLPNAIHIRPIRGLIRLMKDPILKVPVRRLWRKTGMWNKRYGPGGGTRRLHQLPSRSRPLGSLMGAK